MDGLSVLDDDKKLFNGNAISLTSVQIGPTLL